MLTCGVNISTVRTRELCLAGHPASRPRLCANVLSQAPESHSDAPGLPANLLQGHSAKHYSKMMRTRPNGGNRAFEFLSTLGRCCVCYNELSQQFVVILRPPDIPVFRHVMFSPSARVRPSGEWLRGGMSECFSERSNRQSIAFR